MSFIEINNITKKYGKRQILNGISFNAEPGDCIGIVGMNGCGKSTFLKVLAGVHKPNSGTLTYNKVNPFTVHNAFSDYTGYVPQENPLFDNLTVRDNLKLWYCDSTHNLKEDLKSGIPHKFGIDKYLNYTVKHLSGGMRKRLSIACSVAKDPKILILDEPGASLDIVCKNDIRDYMFEFTHNGGIIIIASHEETELSACSRLYIMKNGSLNDLPLYSDISSIMERLVEQDA